MHSFKKINRQTWISLVLIGFWFSISLLTILSLILSPSKPAIALAENETQYKAQNVDIPAEFFGVVGRDPWYEWNTDPLNHPNRPNQAFLENMARNMSAMGSRWVRIEFKADTVPGVRGGVLDYNKYDLFVRQIAPKYNLKILGLLAADSITSKNANDPDLFYPRINDNPDQPNRTNNYIRFFVSRAQEIAERYGEAVQAYEILNEPNLWYGITAKPENFGALLAHLYGTLKPIVPNVKFIMGGLISPNERFDGVDYLDKVYASPAVQDYFKNGQHFGNNFFPFDGIGWHPYYYEVDRAINSTRAAIKKMSDWGDSENKLWVTEVGTPANPGTCGANQEEQSQANYLTRFYTEVAQSNLNDIATVFWFKYEDFYDGTKVNPWGLVRLRATNGVYATTGQVDAYKAAYKAYQRLARPEPPAGLPTAKVPPPAVQYSPSNLTAPFYFPQTGHTLRGEFLNYWLRNGGVDQFGFPLTEEFEEESRADGKKYVVQYFERQRFEFHPEAKDARFRVQLGLLGSDYLALQCRSFPRAEAPKGNTLPEVSYFNETGHFLSFGFKNYWQRYGGLAMYGYPVSEQLPEVGGDGKTYIVQYFERARFEYHPEFAGTKAEVQLGLLGYILLRERGWLR